MNIESVGIIGAGFVGSAIVESIEWSSLSSGIIIDPAKGYTNTYNDILKCVAVFVCVPSPQSDDGSCDTSILESVLLELKKVEFTGVIISKCTAPPDVYTRLNELYPNLVHSPEFLTAANAFRDYTSGKFAIIGGKIPAYRREAERIIRFTQPSLEAVEHCSIGEAALAKYTINSFLATKVVFMNEMYEVANAAGLDYANISKLVSLDPRIGDSHLKVPGIDGLLGFGGMCFPKDTEALLKYAESVNVNLNVLDAAVKKNTLLRLQESK
jgi:UDPglucose 6-dehydrogenase